MTVTVERTHWRNTIVGILDAAFLFDAGEHMACDRVVGDLLRILRIPERAPSGSVPLEVMQEAENRTYSLQMYERHHQGSAVARATTAQDCVTSPDSWRASLMTLITSAYPDLSAEERLLAATCFQDLLAQIGVPQRAATYFPPGVLAAHNELESV